MLRFKEVILPFDRTISNSLKKIYGVCNQKGLYLANMFGFSDRYSVNLLNLFTFDCMTLIMKQEYVLEDRLKFGLRNRFSLYREVGLVKVKRYDLGLPMRGQRTHSNGRTPRRSVIF